MAADELVIGGRHAVLAALEHAPADCLELWLREGRPGAEFDAAEVPQLDRPEPDSPEAENRLPHGFHQTPHLSVSAFSEHEGDEDPVSRIPSHIDSCRLSQSVLQFHAPAQVAQRAQQQQAAYHATSPARSYSCPSCRVSTRSRPGTCAPCASGNSCGWSSTRPSAPWR